MSKGAAQTSCRRSALRGVLCQSVRKKREQGSGCGDGGGGGGGGGDDDDDGDDAAAADDDENRHARRRSPLPSQESLSFHHVIRPKAELIRISLMMQCIFPAFNMYNHRVSNTGACDAWQN
ncbi:hypothetical protein E4U43_002409 [Claviceps pusilla]|uniref:Uncharacterized protein n=1 Tax=Claviceps pusilla TaxID=123648 RepID=A0A9P7SYD9_9HYPO|nr:hypothetical protein E4U43_002409 [Claviceps pusilla]